MGFLCVSGGPPGWCGPGRMGRILPGLDFGMLAAVIKLSACAAETFEPLFERCPLRIVLSAVRMNQRASCAHRILERQENAPPERVAASYEDGVRHGHPIHTS